MATFSRMGAFPVGYFRAFSSWLLRNRVEVSPRIAVINAELVRIGSVTVTYATKEDADGSTRATEDRKGFSVTRNSSLERLCRAYVVNGGNPYDISSFMYPDATEIISENEDGSFVVVESYPYGGVVAPRSAEYNEPIPVEGKATGYEQYKGGMPRHSGYYAARQGGRTDRGSYDSNTVVRYMHQMRSWVNQTIKQRLQDIEWRIIKLCDLREQLLKERDEVLMQAFGGALQGVATFDDERFTSSLRVQNLIQDMDELLYDVDEDGAVQGYSPGGMSGFHPFTFDDVSSEVRDPLG